MAFKHFPVRYAIVAEKDSYNVVLMVDNIEKHFINIPSYKMGAFLEKAALNFPLFIIEEVPNYLEPNSQYIPARQVLVDMVVNQLTDLKANLYRAPNSKVPKHYTNNYKKRGIQERYHKPLWLCTFNVDFDTINITVKNA
jgi:hypothetical protein